MFSMTTFPKTRKILTNIQSLPKIKGNGDICREYAKKAKDDACRRAIVDIPPEPNPVCPKPCKRRAKKPGILHRIKLRLVDGGTNFGTPFLRLKCEPKTCKEVVVPEKKALPAPVQKPLPVPPVRPGVQVSILGANSNLGHFISLLLKQCPCIKKLRLYEARDAKCPECSRDLCNVVQDLLHINTNCQVQAFCCSNDDLNRCLQNTDVVLMLDSGSISMNMPLKERFYYQAPIVKRYADVISSECPKAFIIVCASPIDCMVPLIAETLKETGWYDPRKLLGSLSVPEMRASTLAARALCLEPNYVKIPCVGGTEGEALVPLFSKAVEYFDFARKNAEMLTETVRNAPALIAQCEGQCMKSAELSEAHALSGLVTKVAWALLCKDIPRVTGFVETDAGQLISPARFIANTVEISGIGIEKNLGLPKMSKIETTLVNLALNDLWQKQNMVKEWFMAIDVLINGEGICEKFDIPRKLNDFELGLIDVAFPKLSSNVDLALHWYDDFMEKELKSNRFIAKKNFQLPRNYTRIDDCAFTAVS